ncbi:MULTISPECIES: hypothetical protein [Pseudobutyrivibrio]|uniref:Uncharacterized protein n=1 Tax=Pseudobutyrivibrio xylanivorans TaxID=185007 RepID=A0A1G5RZN1_PSEXY|nr:MULTISPECIES: hypothetical protein [Pseudobutyrivibrio]MDC7279991.1 hypothetical protein [Butyrivibrio fibrisolvens]SCZ79574.1 hypothetical protein SAMN02910350_01861 [Pseudobutyrivibrio xylanivorans]
MKKILKIMGIICTVTGIIGVGAGVFFLAASGVMIFNPAYGDANDMGIVVVAGVMLLVLGIVPLVAGILALRGAKKADK